jgi:glycyl-tRNA synthetase beta subunit
MTQIAGRRPSALEEMGRVPVPDPTERTIQALQREIASSREFADMQVSALKTFLETRLDGMDKAAQIQATVLSRYPQERDEMISHLQSLHEEKFKSVDMQLIEKDKRIDQTTRDGKVAVDAALQAAKEAAGKSEQNFTKQIDQIMVMISTIQKGFDDKNDDLKTRIQALESTRKGAGDLWGFLVGLAGLAIALATIFYKH